MVLLVEGSTEVGIDELDMPKADAAWEKQCKETLKKQGSVDKQMSLREYSAN
ncbi:unnamed protein product [Amoebophrya sp. A25]|nr:unnamed protein product [Amoebophrya sp. A25]|eukprot:GSA25T00003124001.1